MKNRRHFEAIITGIGIAALGTLACLPARLREYYSFSNADQDAIAYLAASLGHDARAGGLYALFVWFVLYTSGRLVGLVRKKPAPFRWQMPAFALAILVLWAMTMAAVEFRTERGVYPTLFDLTVASGGMAYFWDYLVVLTRVEVIAGFAVLSGFFLIWRFRLARGGTYPFGLKWPKAPTVVVASGLATALQFQLWTYSDQLFDSVSTRSVFTFPLSNLKVPLRRASFQVFYGLSSVFREMDYDRDLVGSGLRLLGFSPSSSLDEHGCETHPLRYPLPGTHEDLAIWRAETEGLDGKDGLQLTLALAELSELLFANQQKPVHLFHFLLESFSSDDVHAINKDAPAAVAPYWQAMFDDADSSSPSIIASRMMYQAGARTSHGIGAAHCGLGTMGFGLSFSRDFGDTGARCLPEVLKDAGFVLNQYVGFEPEFDNMRNFYEHRGFKLWHFHNFPDAAPNIVSVSHGAKGISDLHLSETAVSQAIDLLGSPSYSSMLTINGHGPYWVPADYPEQEKQEIEAFIKENPAFFKVRNDDDRVRVIHYVDTVLKLTYKNVSETAISKETLPIFVYSGDHSIAGQHVFSRNQKQTTALDVRRAGAIPFAIRIHEAVFVGVENPERARRQISKVNALLAQTPISQNDIPRFILALLHGTREFQTLKEEHRWHTLGGQVMSPYAEGPEASKRPVVWGVDASMGVFAMARNNQPVFYHKGGWINTPEDLKAQEPLKPTVSAMAAYLQKFAEPCKRSPLFRR